MGNSGKHNIRMNAAKLLLGMGFFFFMHAITAYGQTFSEPAQGPTSAQVSEPINVGLSRQVKPALGSIGANDFTIPFFAIDYGLFPVSSISYMGQNNEDYAGGYYRYDGSILRTAVEETLTPLLTKAWAPKHYHAEVARVAAVSPGIPGQCEQLDDVLPKCSLRYDSASGATHRIFPLRNDIVSAFCKDEDGCEVVLSQKDYDTTNRPGAVASMGPYRLFISQKSGWWRTSLNGAVAGLDGNTTRNNVLTLSRTVASRVVSCYLTDAETITNAPTNTTLEDRSPGFALFNFDPNQVNAYTTMCIIDIWD